MALPKSLASTTPVELSGGVVEVRSLSWNEIKSLPGGGKSNAHSIALATGCTVDEALEWIEDPGTVAGDVMKLINAITAASGLDEGAQKSGGQGDVPGDARAAE